MEAFGPKVGLDAEVETREVVLHLVPDPTLVADDIAEAIAFMVTRPRRAAVNNLWIGPTEQI